MYLYTFQYILLIIDLLIYINYFNDFMNDSKKSKILDNILMEHKIHQ